MGLGFPRGSRAAADRSRTMIRVSCSTISRCPIGVPRRRESRLGRGVRTDQRVGVPRSSTSTSRGDLSDRLTLTSITGLSDFESSRHYRLGDARHRSALSDVESDVVYQELQLNAELDRFDRRDRCVVFPRRRLRQPRHGLADYDRRGTSVFPGSSERQRCRRRQSGRTVCSSRSSPTACRTRSRSAPSRTSTWHITERLNLTPGVRYALDEKEVTRDALSGERLRAVRRRAVDVDLRRRRLGQYGLAADARLSSHR